MNVGGSFCLHKIHKQSENLNLNWLDIMGKFFIQNRIAIGFVQIYINIYNNNNKNGLKMPYEPLKCK